MTTVSGRRSVMGERDFGLGTAILAAVLAHADGPVPARDVLDLLDDLGYTADQVKRMRRKIGVDRDHGAVERDTSGGRGQEFWTWTLPPAAAECPVCGHDPHAYNPGVPFRLVDDYEPDHERSVEAELFADSPPALPGREIATDTTAADALASPDVAEVVEGSSSTGADVAWRSTAVCSVCGQAAAVPSGTPCPYWPNGRPCPGTIR
jgi:hypothetical protein